MLILVSTAMLLLVFVSLVGYKKYAKKLPHLSRPKHLFSRAKGDHEVIIIGSGVLGSAMASVLGRDGRKVVVIERELKEPDRIVGELLQPGGYKALCELGLKNCVEGVDAHNIKGYVIYNNLGSVVHVPYHLDENKVDICGKSFHHGRFVMNLRSEAQAQENVTYIEGTAIKLIDDNGAIIGIEYRGKNSNELMTLYAPLTVVADGCFSKFRKQLVEEAVHVSSHFIGMLMQDCPQTKVNHAELILAQPSPVLIYQISSNTTRILIDVKGGMPKNVKKYMAEQIAPQLPDHIQAAFQDGIQNNRIRSMPNSFLPPSPKQKCGVIVLGDALNMRHPLTGGGMSVALNDVVIWRDLLRSVPDLSNYKEILQALEIFCLRRKQEHSFVVNILAQSLYELFAANDEYLISLKESCFAYFQLGGQCISGPVGLLSVLNPKPHILIGHFFAVVLYAIYSVFKAESLWMFPKSFFRSTMIFLRACQVLFPLIWTEMRPLII